MMSRELRDPIPFDRPATYREWLKEWVDEIFDMGRISREKLFMKLTRVEAEDEPAQSTSHKVKN